MDVILHIGHSKTGTSTLQQFLFDNKDKLLEHGVLFPALSPSACFQLPLLFGERSRAYDSSEMVRIAQEQLDHLNRTAKHSDARSLLISAESLFDVSIESVVGLFDFPIDAVHVVIYIRPQHDLYLSLIQQQIKASSVYCDPVDYYYSHYSPIMKLQQSVPLEHIHIRPFIMKHLHEQDIISDFLQVLSSTINFGFSKEEFLNSTERLNTSLSAEQMLALYAMRKAVLPDCIETYHPLSNAVLDFFTALNKVQKLEQTKPKLAQLYVEYIAAKHATDTAYVDALYGSCFSSLFYKDISVVQHNAQIIEQPVPFRSIFSSYDVELYSRYVSIFPYYIEQQCGTDERGASIAWFMERMGEAFLDAYLQFLQESARCIAIAQLPGVHCDDLSRRTPYDLFFQSFLLLHQGKPADAIRVAEIIQPAAGHGAIFQAHLEAVLPHRPPPTHGSRILHLARAAWKRVGHPAK